MSLLGVVGPVGEGRRAGRFGTLVRVVGFVVRVWGGFDSGRSFLAIRLNQLQGGVLAIRLNQLQGGVFAVWFDRFQGGGACGPA